MADRPTVAVPRLPARAAQPAAPAPPVAGTPRAIVPADVWKSAVFRKLLEGERNVNALIQAALDAGAPTRRDAQWSVLDLLKVPFPSRAQVGGIPTVGRDRGLASAQPDAPPDNFTGRFESTTASGERYFWAVNQAGRAVIAVRTMRAFNQGSRRHFFLHGDVQKDGSAVLFWDRDPYKLWGYLQRDHNTQQVHWRYGSYLGPRGPVVVDADASRHEVFEYPPLNARPTVMESMFGDDRDDPLARLLREREWFPLTKQCAAFLQKYATSDLLKDLIDDYLKIEPFDTSATRSLKQAAAARIRIYLSHLLWELPTAEDPHRGSEGRYLHSRPGKLDLPSSLAGAGQERVNDFIRESGRVIPYGHHNNLDLARFVAKTWLAEERHSRGLEKRSLLEWISKVVSIESTLADKQHAERISGLLGLGDISRKMGAFQYRLTLNSDLIVTAKLTVERLTDPKWTQDYDVTLAVWPVPAPSARIFEFTVDLPVEWSKDDFEGWVYLGQLAFAVESPAFSLSLGEAKVGMLVSANGPRLDLQDVDIGGGMGKGSDPVTGPGKNKLSVKVGPGGLVGRISLRKAALVDLTRPFPSHLTVSSQLASVTHFGYDKSKLTEGARQYLRHICADRLAVLMDPSTQIVIVAHTDLKNSWDYNLQLSDERAKNVKMALHDILAPVLGPKRLDDIPTYALSKARAWLIEAGKLRPGQPPKILPTPEYRRVDLMVNARIVAILREGP